METKICTKCKEEKELSFFKKSPKYSKGVVSQCNICVAKYRREFRAKNIELTREIGRREYKNNKEKRNASTQKWRDKNKDYILKYSENYRNLDREKYNKTAKESRERNKEAYRLKRK